MNEKKYESTFIPCGDAVEKMELFAENTRGESADCETKEATEKDAD